MELIRPAEISGKIMTLIESAQEKVIIVSPYNKINSWTKLTNRIRDAKNRGIKFEWYIRKNVEGNFNEITELGIIPIEIENLHCKIYFNEKTAVVTSMNLHFFSDTKSIDIGYCTTNENEYYEIVEFVNVFIARNNDKAKQNGKNVGLLIDENKFHLPLIAYLKSNGLLKYCEISNLTTEFGEKITVKKFKQNYELIFEPRNSYYRVDLRINFDYKKRVEIYEKLESQKDSLIMQIGNTIEFGSQLKRLKIDITNVKGKTNEWTEKNFFELKDLFDRIIYVLNSILD